MEHSESQHALCRACLEDNFGRVDELLKQRIDVNAVSADFAPLTVAAGRGVVPILELLLAQATDETLNHVDHSGETPLIAAALRGKVEAITRLLDSHADPTQCKQDGLSPRSCARTRGHTDAMAMIELALKPTLLTLHISSVASEVVELSCVNMSGKHMCRLHVKPDTDLGATRHQISAYLNKPMWSLALLSQNSMLLHVTDNLRPILDLLNAAPEPEVLGSQDAQKPLHTSISSSASTDILQGGLVSALPTRRSLKEDIHCASTLPPMPPTPELDSIKFTVDASRENIFWRNK